MSRSRKTVNPAAQKALDQLKEETAAEIGLQDYKNRYKGALTSADNGRVGGHMVRKMIEAQEQKFMNSFNSGSTASNTPVKGTNASSLVQSANTTASTGNQTLTSQYDINNS